MLFRSSLMVIASAADLIVLYVALELNPRGAKLFENITGANVGRRLAITGRGGFEQASHIRHHSQL